VVECLDVTVAAGEKNPDHGLRPRREIRLAGRRAPRDGRVGAHNSIAPQHRTESQPREAHAEVGQERAARETATEVQGLCFVGLHLGILLPDILPFVHEIVVAKQ
jgi:hypothetical protein